MNFTDDSELTFGDSSDLKIYHTTNNIVRINSGDLIFNSFVTDGDIKFQLDNGSGSLTEYMRLDGGDEKIVFSKRVIIGEDAITTDKPGLVVGDTTNGGQITIRGLSPTLFFDKTGTGNPKILTDSGTLEIKKGTLDAEGTLMFSLTDSTSYFANTNLGIKRTNPVSALEVKGEGTAPSYFTHTYGVDNGLTVVGNESLIEIISADTGSHGGSFNIRGGNKGYSFINNPDSFRLELKYFEADANNFSTHASGTNISTLNNLLFIDKVGLATFWGKLGVGVDPDTKLHIKGDGDRMQISSADYDLVKIGAFGDSGADIDNGFLNLLLDGVEKLRLLASGDSYFNGGNVGFGESDPEYKIDIGGSGSGINLKGGNNRIYFSGYRALEGATDGTLLQIGEGYGTARMYGRVGFGISPGTGNTVHIYKNATIGAIGATTVANGGLRIQDSGANMYFDGNSIVLDNTGYITTNGAHEFVLGTNNTARLEINANGNATFTANLGVSGKTPTHGLTLAQGTGDGSKIVWSDATPTFAASIYANSSNDKLTFATKNASGIETTALEINTSQNVNITSKPNSGLAYDLLINVGTSPDGVIGYQTQDQLASLLAVNANSNWVKTGNNIYNTNSANVGISETSPFAKLHIKGSDTAVTAASAQGNLLVLEDSENGLSILSSTAGAGYINFGDSDDNDVGMIIYGHSSNSMDFWTNAGKRMTIDSSGYVKWNK